MLAHLLNNRVQMLEPFQDQMKENIYFLNHIRETPTLLPRADSSTDTMKPRIFDTFLHF